MPADAAIAGSHTVFDAACQHVLVPLLAAILPAAKSARLLSSAQDSWSQTLLLRSWCWTLRWWRSPTGATGAI